MINFIGKIVSGFSFCIAEDVSFTLRMSDALILRPFTARNSSFFVLTFLLWQFFLVMSLGHNFRG